MELSAPLLAGLKVAGDPQLSDTHFAALLNTTDALMRGVDAAVSRVYVSSACALLAEAARVDAPASAVQALLEDAGWSSARAAALVALCSDPARSPGYRAAVAPALSSFASASLPSLTSASHCTELYLRSNMAEQIRQPVVFLRLHAQGGGPPSLSFTASAEDVQDMLAKVKEAVRAAQPQSHAEHS